MPWGLKRYYGTGALHFITCSCYQRAQLLNTPERRDLLLKVIEQMRVRYRFAVVGYVVMPEHVHLLISEPQIANPSTVIQAIKLGFVRRYSQVRVPHFSPVLGEVGILTSHHFWMKRFYDFNVWSQQKESEKLHYMHQNPVVRGLVARPEDWRWSSFRFYTCGETGLVRINDWSWWEEKIKAKVG
ncbi:MAG TPA: transposase [Candidatus Sulfotelmatobacter sp.]|jgi:putative transposase